MGGLFQRGKSRRVHSMNGTTSARCLVASFDGAFLNSQESLRALAPSARGQPEDCRKVEAARDRRRSFDRPAAYVAGKLQ